MKLELAYPSGTGNFIIMKNFRTEVTLSPSPIAIRHIKDTLELNSVTKSSLN